ncbi:MAG: DUF6279 family lipoprotein [Burkholderiales bacterium]|nr:DUF6279 family lipoprotein [Burkholderiales bacterium]
MNVHLLSSRIFRIIGLLLALLMASLLPGCSAIRVGYNQAPEVAYWWLDGYFDFSSAQAERVRADLVQLQAWHRAKELPLYLGLLERVGRLLPGNVTAEQLCDLYTDARQRLSAMAEQAEPSLSSVTLSLQPEQLARLARQLDKRSDNWREEWLDGTPTERQARRSKQLIERVETLYGRLEGPQRAALRASVAASSYDADLAYRESQRRHTDTGAERNRLEARALLERALASPDPVYRALQDKLVQDSCRTYADLHNSTSPKQRSKALETVKNYEADVRALMSRRP